jgi:hypothetical protein
MTRRCQYLFSMLLFAGTAWWAVAQPTADELEQNRSRLHVLRKNAEQMARLRDNLQHFLALPEKKQNSLVQLDHDLHEWPAAKKERYLAVLERYADWLEQLRQQDSAAYKAIKDAPNVESRLVLIKGRRDREWMQTQPQAQREEWARLPAEERGAYVAKLRQDERMRRQQWVVAQRFWKELEAKKELPCRLSDFSEKVKNYVKDYLLPKLSEAEKQQLSAAEGRWPDYPLALVEIAAKRPSAMPPLRAEDSPRKFAELPEPIRKHLIEPKKAGKDVAKAKLQKQYMQYDGGPYFASKVVELALKDGKIPFEHEYLACTYKSLLKPMKEFVDGKLMPALKDHPADESKFKESQGKWPDFPQAIQELSQKHNLQPPWHILPEPEKWKWDNYRYLKRRPPDLAKDQPES